VYCRQAQQNFISFVNIRVCYMFRSGMKNI
jgi:hypothetical protein